MGKGGGLKGPWTGAFQQSAEQNLLPLYQQFAMGYQLPGVNFGANPLEQQAANSLMGFNPASYFAGAMGGAGGRGLYPGGGAGMSQAITPQIKDLSHNSRQGWVNIPTLQGQTQGPQSGAAQRGAPVAGGGGKGGGGGGKNGRGGGDSLVGQGTGTLGRASTLAAADPYGAGGPLGQMLSSNWLNVQNDPAIQARNQALTSGAIQSIQQALPQINSGVQAATGGSGVGSALLQQRNALASNVLTGLNENLANLGAQDLARREASQQWATGQGLGLPLQQAQVLGQLGGQQLQYGTDIGQLLLGSQLGLGNTLAQRQITGAMAPYQLGLDFMNAARAQAVQGGSGIGGLLAGLGGMAGGVGGIMGASALSKMV